ncbi:MAG: hypothetical protein QOF61_1738, partial [Acidobacteriota bacterium]|nr:hypothetical protein [Acidobacteriota bacterium]
RPPARISGTFQLVKFIEQAFERVCGHVYSALYVS